MSTLVVESVGLKARLILTDVLSSSSLARRSVASVFRHHDIPGCRPRKPGMMSYFVHKSGFAELQRESPKQAMCGKS